jgi:glutathione S-transferase
MEIIGSFVSPYVRKVLACLELKGLTYQVDPITPFYGNDEFERLSPLRRIPVLIDGDVAISDSSVICAYLDEAYPDPPLLPASPADRARARWLEEYADTRLGDVLIWGLFYQRFVRPQVWDEPTDDDRVARTLSTDLPRELDYLEGQLPADGFLFGQVGLADFAIASFFRNADYAQVHVDANRWPRTAGFIARVLDHPIMRKLGEWEAVQVGATIKGRRQALLDAGAPLIENSYGEREPRRGVMAL